MKSLEIVNTAKIKPVAYGSCVLHSEELETIKQDLEVLEIIKKKRVDVLYLVVAINNDNCVKEQLKYYNRTQSKIYQLTLEELLKLKQWMEENENDR